MALKVPPRLRGWSWFPPYQDGGTHCLTDSGQSWGCSASVRRTTGTRPCIWVPSRAGRAAAWAPCPVSLRAAPVKPGGQRGRGPGPGPGGPRAGRRLLGAQLTARCSGCSWAGGAQSDRSWPRSQGEGAAAGLAAARRLQVEEGRTGRSTLYAVTQELTRPDCLATAVDGETGDLLWQRQLGLVCQGDRCCSESTGPERRPCWWSWTRAAGCASSTRPLYQKHKLKTRGSPAASTSRRPLVEEVPRFPPFLVADDRGETVAGRWPDSRPRRAIG